MKILYVTTVGCTMSFLNQPNDIFIFKQEDL